MAHLSLLIHGSPPKTSAPQGRGWQETPEYSGFVNSQGCCDRGEHVLGGFNNGEFTSHRSVVPVWDDRKGKIIEDLPMLSKPWHFLLVSKSPQSMFLPPCCLSCLCLLVVLPKNSVLGCENWPPEAEGAHRGRQIQDYRHCNLLQTYRWATEKQKDSHTPRQERETYICQTRQRRILASQRHWDISKVILMSNIKRQSA